MSFRILNVLKNFIQLEDILLIGRLIKIKIEEEQENVTDDIFDVRCYNKRLFNVIMDRCGIIEYNNAQFNPFSKNYRNMVKICYEDLELLYSSRVIITVIEDNDESKIIYRSEYDGRRSDYIFTKMSCCNNDQQWYKGFTREYIANYDSYDNEELLWDIDSSHIPMEYHIFKFGNNIINADSATINGRITFRAGGSFGKDDIHIEIAMSMIESSRSKSL